MFDLGQAYLSSKNLAAAIKCFEQSNIIFEKIKITDKDYNVPLWLAKCYKANNQEEKMAQIIEKYNLNPA